MVGTVLGPIKPGGCDLGAVSRDQYILCCTVVDAYAGLDCGVQKWKPHS